ncbi:hypothetical protein [Methylomicrobium lacus]|uniref:hypothetical protein n=1 Tax=Methylomicrobium lacus TaxID=136992 RepID=UPI0035A909FB
MTSFSEGFSAGFGLVDDAIQRRRRNDMEQQKIGLENAQYQDRVDRQKTLDQRDQDWHNQDLETAARKERFDREKYQNELGLKNRELGLREADTGNDQTYRKAQLENQSRQIDIQGMQAQSAIDENQAQTERYRLETQFAKEQKNRDDAQRRVMANLISQDQNTGLTTIRLTKGNEQNDLNDIQTALGVNVGKISSDLQTFNNDLAHIKSAVADPRYFQQNKPAVLKAFNDIEGSDINKGLGDYDGDNPEFKGGKVVSKEISDVYPSPDGKGFVFNVRTVIDKGGKKLVDEGPMTQYRSSSPADDQIRVVGVDQIIQRIEGYDAIGKVLESNPDFVRAVNGVVGSQAKDGKKDITKVKVPVYDSNGMPAGDKEVLYNGQSFIDPEKQMKAQEDQAEAAKWAANAPSLDERRRKAEYVLNNRSQFKDRPDIIQAAEAAMRAANMPQRPAAQSSPHFANKPDLSPVLANVMRGR